MKKTIGVSAVFLVLFSLALYLLIYHSDIYLTFLDRKRLAAFVKSYGSLSPLIFITLQIFQVLFAPIPGEVTGFLGGFLYGNFFGILYSTIGLGIGSWLAFLFARLAGQPLVERIVRYKTIQRFDFCHGPPGDLDRLSAFSGPRISQRLPVLHFGIGSHGREDLLDYFFCGRLLGTMMLTLQGSLVRDKNYFVLGVVIGLSLLGVLIAYLFRGKLEAYFERHHFKRKSPGSKPHEK